MADTTADSFSTMMQSRLGGVVGSHAKKLGYWFTAGPWAMGLAIIAWLLSIARQTPCHQADIYKPINNYYRMCYSDVPILYQVRNLGQGESPYAFEYPVLTNAIIDFARWVAHLFGARIGSQIKGQDALDGANIFFLVTIVLMFVCFLGLVAFQIDTVKTRPFDAFMVAGAPTLIMTALINWDLLCVMLAAGAVWAWSKRRPGWAGVFIGLGIAAKLYPFLLLIPLFALCVRTKKIKEYAITVGTTIIAWTAPNLIVYLRNPEEWLYFWTFNVDRGSDLGSFYYAMTLLKMPIANPSTVQSVLMVTGALLVLVVGLMAPRRPRFGQLAFLMVCWFLLVNKVYSPQYVLWLLPLLVLARPRWNAYIIWTVAELGYFAAVWGHLGQSMLGPNSQGKDWVYIIAIFVRMAAHIMLIMLVMREILKPELDVVRADGQDDPSGGIFDHAPDADYMRFLLGDPTKSAAATAATNDMSLAGTGPATGDVPAAVATTRSTASPEPVPQAAPDK